MFFLSTVIGFLVLLTIPFLPLPSGDTAERKE